MAHFVNRSRGYLISTSYKVMYTLFCQQSSLQVVAHIHMTPLIYLQQLTKFGTLPHYLIVRNPYHRVESFYKDKLRKEFLRHCRPYDQIERCQRVFFPYLQIRPQDSPQEICEKFLGLSFAQFVELLPEIYREDAHFSPQVLTTKLHFQDRPILPLTFTRILKLEAQDDLHYLEKRLHLNLSQKINSTEKIVLSNPWTLPLRTIVNDLYQADFDRFDYELCL